MRYSLTATLGWLAVAVGALSFFAQYRRLVKMGLDGVSLSTWLLFGLNGGLWIFYGALYAHSTEVVVGSLVCLPFQFAVVMRLSPWRHYRATLGALGVFVGCCLMPGFFGGWQACAYGAGVAMILLRLPQLFELTRSKNASGVSSISWFVVAASTGLWVLYFGALHLWAPMAAYASSGLLSVVVGIMAVWRHHQHHSQTTFNASPVFLGDVSS
ncbi:MAG TPA: hypothetical protein VIJ86_02615 [Acidimicrobiales bacterium]